MDTPGRQMKGTATRSGAGFVAGGFWASAGGARRLYLGRLRLRQQLSVHGLQIQRCVLCDDTLVGLFKLGCVFSLCHLQRQLYQVTTVRRQAFASGSTLSTHWFKLNL